MLTMILWMLAAGILVGSIVAVFEIKAHRDLRRLR